MSKRDTLIALLADGELHSGEALAEALDVSGTAVWKELRALESLGLDVRALPGEGYRLHIPLVLLEREAVLAEITAPVRERLHSLELATVVDSTNTRLLDAAPPPPGDFTACLAEFQLHGRGRRGHDWIAPFGSGLCLSLGWSFAETPAQVGTLPLAVGVAILRAACELGIDGLALKWPNDVLWKDRKLGGVLVELRSEGDRPPYLVVGIGLNVALSTAAQARIASSGSMAAVDLAEICQSTPPRERVAGRIIEHTVQALQSFQEQGFSAFHTEWDAADVLRGRGIEIELAGQHYRGRGAGIDADGALLLREDGGTRRFLAGEVSVSIPQ